MSFNATEFFAGLAGQPATVPPAATPAGRQLPLKLTGDPLAGSRFEGWVRRRDASGRMGWERPGLPDDTAWWRRFRFEELPRP